MNDISKAIMQSSTPKKSFRGGDEDIGDVGKEEFNILINEIYEIMIHYSNRTKVMLTENSPIQIGNVAFWFHTDPKN